MENNPITVMLFEHDIISKAVGITQKMDGEWQNDLAGFKTKINKIIQFLREYGDEYHHRKEEEILFPAIKNCPDFMLGELVDEFEDHHDSFRDSAIEILELLKEVEYEKAYKTLVQYLDELLDHIGAENDELFIIAETLLTEEELETIFFKFKDLDMELGEETKKELEEEIIQMEDSH